MHVGMSSIRATPLDPARVLGQKFIFQLQFDFSFLLNDYDHTSRRHTVFYGTIPCTVKDKIKMSNDELEFRQKRKCPRV